MDHAPSATAATFVIYRKTSSRKNLVLRLTGLHGFSGAAAVRFGIDAGAARLVELPAGWTTPLDLRVTVFHRAAYHAPSKARAEQRRGFLFVGGAPRWLDPTTAAGLSILSIRHRC